MQISKLNTVEVRLLQELLPEKALPPAYTIVGWLKSWDIDALTGIRFAVDALSELGSNIENLIILHIVGDSGVLGVTAGTGAYWWREGEGQLNHPPDQEVPYYMTIVLPPAEAYDGVSNTKKEDA